MDIIRPFFHEVYGHIHLFLQTKLKAKMPIREALYIRQCCDILDGLLDTGEEYKIFSAKHLERYFLFAMMWSLGAVLELDGRVLLQEYILSFPSKMAWPKINEDETIFEYMVDENGLWQHWSERVEPFIYPSDEVLEFSTILVPNVDNVRTNYLMNLISKQHKAVLLIGIIFFIKKMNFFFNVFGF